mmetsp:Transcript_5472/g.12456  ORF Transcript_5472/g.12456 Transcript_5472/m.12456 type:complete len:227 (-) Transcript_5472:4850-5530(-)
MIFHKRGHDEKRPQLQKSFAKSSFVLFKNPWEWDGSAADSRDMESSLGIHQDVSMNSSFSDIDKLRLQELRTFAKDKFASWSLFGKDSVCCRISELVLGCRSDLLVEVVHVQKVSSGHPIYVWVRDGSRQDRMEELLSHIASLPSLDDESAFLPDLDQADAKCKMEATFSQNSVFHNVPIAECKALRTQLRFLLTNMNGRKGNDTSAILPLAVRTLNSNFVPDQSS